MTKTAYDRHTGPTSQGGTSLWLEGEVYVYVAGDAWMTKLRRLRVATAPAVAPHAVIVVESARGVNSMPKDKTPCPGARRPSGAVCGPAQPILRGINLVQCLQDASWCDCLCRECPPWEHKLEYCASRCLTVHPDRAVDYPHY